MPGDLGAQAIHQQLASPAHDQRQSLVFATAAAQGYGILNEGQLVTRQLPECVEPPLLLRRQGERLHPAEGFRNCTVRGLIWLQKFGPVSQQIAALARLDILMLRQHVLHQRPPVITAADLNAQLPRAVGLRDKDDANCQYDDRNGYRHHRQHGLTKTEEGHRRRPRQGRASRPALKLPQRRGGAKSEVKSLDYFPTADCYCCIPCDGAEGTDKNLG